MEHDYRYCRCINCDNYRHKIDHDKSQLMLVLRKRYKHSFKENENKPCDISFSDIISSVNKPKHVNMINPNETPEKEPIIKQERKRRRFSQNQQFPDSGFSTIPATPVKNNNNQSIEIDDKFLSDLSPTTLSQLQANLILQRLDNYHTNKRNGIKLEVYPHLTDYLQQLASLYLPTATSVCIYIFDYT